jgi:hypothetical protein
MTVRVQDNLILFLPDSVVMRPEKLKVYFQQEKTLQISLNSYLCFWMQNSSSAEWNKHTSPNLDKVVKVFNEFLHPTERACVIISNYKGSIHVGALDNDFTFLLLSIPLK